MIIYIVREIKSNFLRFFSSFMCLLGKTASWKQKYTSGVEGHIGCGFMHGLMFYCMILQQLALEQDSTLIATCVFKTKVFVFQN